MRFVCIFYGRTNPAFPVFISQPERKAKRYFRAIERSRQSGLSFPETRSRNSNLEVEDFGVITVIIVGCRNGRAMKFLKLSSIAAPHRIPRCPVGSKPTALVLRQGAIRWSADRSFACNLYDRGARYVELRADESTPGRNCTHMTTFEASHPESVR